MRRTAKIATAVLLIVVVVAIGTVLALRWFDIDATRTLLVQRLEAITGREVTIAGDFELVASLVPTLAAEGLTVANAPWGSEEPMLQAERVEVALEAFPLLWRGDLLVDRLEVSGVELLLETGPEGRANWRFEPDAAEVDEGERSEFLLSELSIAGGQLIWRDLESDRTETLLVDQLGWTAESLTSPVVLQGRGQLDGAPLAISGELGPIADLLAAGTEAYPVALEGRLGGVAAQVEGQMVPGEGRLDLALALSGEEVANLGELVEAEVPALGSFAARGQLTGTVQEPALAELSGRIGEENELHLVLQDGRIGDLLAVREVELPVELEGPSVTALGQLVERELPELGAFRFQGTLTGSMEALALTDLAGHIGAEEASAIRITSGTVADLLAGEGILLEVGAEGAELAEMAAALGIEMAPFGPYIAHGMLEGSFDELALRNAEATAGDEAARITASGAVGRLLALAGLDLNARVEGQDLAGLAPLADIELPSSEPYRLSGHLTGSIEELRIENIDAQIAESPFTGWLAVVRRQAEPPRVEGALTFARLDLDRLLELAERTEAEAEEVWGPAEAEEPLPLEGLDEIEAELALRADEVRLDQTDFSDASMSLVLQEGRLSVQGLQLQVAGGTVVGGGAIEAETEDLAEVTVRLSANDIDIGQVLTDWTATERVAGEVDIDLNLDSTGRSLDELLGSLEGSAALVGEEGQVRDAPLDLLVTDLDILRALPPFWRGGDNDVRLNCLITEMDIEEGVARTEAMLDTERMTLLGQGTVDLGERQLDLSLQPRAKTQKLSTLEVPIDITGSLTEPAVQPRAGTAAAQAVRGVLGGLLIPLNQLSALFGEETVDACVEALQQARERRQAAASDESPS